MIFLKVKTRKELHSFMLFILVVMAFIVIVPESTSAKDITKTRSADNNIMIWEENSTHYIDGRLTIEENETLIIEAGVKVYFNHAGPAGENPHSLYIKGKLLAQGKPERPIIFTSNATDPSPNDWDKIKFKKEADESSIIEYAIIEYSIQGIQAERVNITIRNNIIRKIGKYGIKCVSSAPRITNNTISSENIGIRCVDENGDGPANPYIENNILENNAYYGILLNSNSEPIIKSNVIKNNGEYGIYSALSNPVVEDNDINYNKIGIAFVNSRGNVTNNEISNSTEIGILMKYGEGITIDKNVFENNTIGISAINTKATINNNELKGNQTKSIEMTDCEIVIDNNNHNGVISSFNQVTLKVVNSDGYPIKGTSVTVTDVNGNEIIRKDPDENSTVRVNLKNYEIDPSGKKKILSPHKVTVEKEGILTENIISDLTIPLQQVKLEISFIPILSVISHEESGKTLTISGEVDLDDLDTAEMDYKILVKINGGEWEEAVGKTKWAYVYDSQIEEGKHEVEVKVADGIKDPTITERIEIEEKVEMNYLLQIAVAFVVVIIIMILLLAAMKRGKQGEEIEEDGHMENTVE